MDKVNQVLNLFGEELKPAPKKEMTSSKQDTL